MSIRRFLKGITSGGTGLGFVLAGLCRGRSRQAAGKRRMSVFAAPVAASAAVILAVSGWATYVLAAPVFQGSGGVSASPDEVYTGDSLEITVTGLPERTWITGGSVTLGGKRLAVPGVFGKPGSQPVSGPSGVVSFTTSIPLGVPIGPAELRVSNLADGGLRTATVTVLNAEIVFLQLRLPPMRPLRCGGWVLPPPPAPEATVHWGSIRSPEKAKAASW